MIEITTVISVCTFWNWSLFLEHLLESSRSLCTEIYSQPIPLSKCTWFCNLQESLSWHTHTHTGKDPFEYIHTVEIACYSGIGSKVKGEKERKRERDIKWQLVACLQGERKHIERENKRQKKRERVKEAERGWKWSILDCSRIYSLLVSCGSLEHKDHPLLSIVYSFAWFPSSFRLLPLSR